MILKVASRVKDVEALNNFKKTYDELINFGSDEIQYGYDYTITRPIVTGKTGYKIFYGYYSIGVTAIKSTKLNRFLYCRVTWIRKRGGPYKDIYGKIIKYRDKEPKVGDIIKFNFANKMEVIQKYERIKICK